jgi:parvulin-like peptidyl-prolyl isomerase
VSLSLDFGNSTFSADRAIDQLHRFGLLPQLLQEIAIDDLVTKAATATHIDLDASSIEFAQKYTELEKIPLFQGMIQSQLEAICDRELRLQKFKLAKWGDKVGSYFTAHGNRLDRVLVSIFQVKDLALAQEFFFRIESGEQSFAEIALDYSQGIHAQNGGRLGPLLWVDLAPELRKIVEKLEIGALSPLFQLDGYYTLLRLDEREPALLDQLRYQFLLDQLFSNWLEAKFLQ